MPVTTVIKAVFGTPYTFIEDDLGNVTICRPSLQAQKFPIATHVLVRFVGDWLRRQKIKELENKTPEEVLGLEKRP